MVSAQLGQRLGHAECMNTALLASPGGGMAATMRQGHTPGSWEPVNGAIADGFVEDNPEDRSQLS